MVSYGSKGKSFSSNRQDNMVERRPIRNSGNHHRAANPKYGNRMNQISPVNLEENPEATIKMPVHADWSALNSNNRIVAFYNFYIAKPHFYLNIVKEQLALLNMTGLLQQLDAVYYVAIGAMANSIPRSISDILQNTKGKRGNKKFVQLRNTVNRVDETLTLSYLYDFCQHNPDSKVLYFHDKGSYNYRGENVFTFPANSRIKFVSRAGARQPNA